MGAIRTVLTDRDDLLEEREEQEDGVDLGKIQAKVIMRLGEEKWTVWVDTGAEYSVVREECFVKLTEKKLVKECLPVSKVKLYGALGRKGERVTKQILVDATHNDKKLEIRCLVVKGLFTDMIIGMDFIRKVQAVIDFQKETMEGRWGRTGNVRMGVNESRNGRERRFRRPDEHRTRGHKGKSWREG